MQCQFLKSTTLELLSHSSKQTVPDAAFTYLSHQTPSYNKACIWFTVLSFITVFWVDSSSWLAFLYMSKRQLLVKGTNARPPSPRPLSLIHPEHISVWFIAGPSVGAADKGANQPPIEWLPGADTWHWDSDQKLFSLRSHQTCSRG